MSGFPFRYPRIKECLRLPGAFAACRVLLRYSRQGIHQHAYACATGTGPTACAAGYPTFFAQTRDISGSGLRRSAETSTSYTPALSYPVFFRFPPPHPRHRVAADVDRPLYTPVRCDLARYFLVPLLALDAFSDYRMVRGYSAVPFRTTDTLEAPATGSSRTAVPCCQRAHSSSTKKTNCLSTSLTQLTSPINGRTDLLLATAASPS